MTKVEKVRNEIRFIREDGKYWFIDINDCSMHGFSGKIVKRVPNGGHAAMNDYRWNHCDVITKILDLIDNGAEPCLVKFVEKAINATANASEFRCGWGLWNAARDYKKGEYTDRQLIAAIGKLREDFQNNRHYGNFSWTVTKLLEYCESEKKFGKNSPYGKLVEKYGISKVRRAYDNYNGYDVCSISTNWLERIFKYKNDETMKRLVRLGIVNSREIDNIIRHIFCWSSEMGIKLPKGNLIDEYELLKNNYETWKSTAKENALNEVQNLVTEFTDGDFTAFIPHTIDELVKEGSEQRNCLGDYWLRNYGNSDKHFQRGVFFVRKNSNPSKSYITCDFDRDSGYIDQYYGKCNERVRDKDALDFKKKLQKHIFNCLGIEKDANFYF